LTAAACAVTGRDKQNNPTEFVHPGHSSLISHLSGERLAFLLAPHRTHPLVFPSARPSKWVFRFLIVMCQMMRSKDFNPTP
jgi:hypothetical protein